MMCLLLLLLFRTERHAKEKRSTTKPVTPEKQLPVTEVGRRAVGNVRGNDNAGSSRNEATKDDPTTSATIITTCTILAEARALGSRSETERRGSHS